jgi:hypothetical protein
VLPVTAEPLATAFRNASRPERSGFLAIETSQGAAVEQLLEAGMEVYPINSKSAKSYRSGAVSSFCDRKR